MGEWVWLHSNFLKLFNDDPSDTGLVAMDAFKMDADGRAIEHWESVQVVGTPERSGTLACAEVPRANYKRNPLSQP